MDVYVVIIIRAADLVYLTGLDGDRTCKTVEGEVKIALKTDFTRPPCGAFTRSCMCVCMCGAE